MAPDFEPHALFYNPYIPSHWRGGSWLEREKQNIDKNIMGLEDLHTTIDQTIAAGDKVVTVTTTTGTKNGKHVSFSTVLITRFADGKMVEDWMLLDAVGSPRRVSAAGSTPGDAGANEAGWSRHIERRPQTRFRTYVTHEGTS